MNQVSDAARPEAGAPDACVPTSTCASRGYECGSFTNNCGQAVGCGGCATGTCGAIKPFACDGSCDLRELAQIPHGKVAISNATSPTKEYIFPALLETKALPGATDKWHLYYAPHDGYDGGNGVQGISLAVASSPTGPWSKVGVSGSVQAPVIPNKWGYFHQVSHVSSPHPMIGDGRELHLFYHGENSVSRVATSTDGQSFTIPIVPNEVLNAAKMPGLDERSYARVFRHRIPNANSRYAMLYMGNKGGTRGIYRGWSSDLVNWTFAVNPVIAPNADEGGQIAGPFLLPWRGKFYVLYHKSGGTSIQAAEVDRNLNLVRRCGAIFTASSGAPENGRAAQPFIFDDGTRIVLYYDASAKNSQILLSTKPIAGAKVVDNTAAQFSGSWSTGTTTAGFYGTNYRHDANSGKGSKSATYALPISKSGFFRVQMRWPAHTQRASSIPIEIAHADGKSTVRINQRYHGDQWVDLGFYRFTPSRAASVKITTAGTTDFVIADAVRIVAH